MLHQFPSVLQAAGEQQQKKSFLLSLKQLMSTSETLFMGEKKSKARAIIKTTSTAASVVGMKGKCFSYISPW